jgi:hypothetical protein
VYLDIALCNFADKRYFANILQQLKVLTLDAIISPIIFPWIHSRFNPSFKLTEFKANFTNGAHTRIACKITNAFQHCLKFVHTIVSTRLHEDMVESIVSILCFAVNLRSINFIDMNAISVSANKKLINGLLNNLTPSCLIEMNFQGCHKLTDLHVIQLSEKFSFLEKVDFSKCILLTDKAICSVSKRCRNLSHLNVSMLVNLTDKSITVLASHSFHLTKLILGGDQTKFSSDCLIALFQDRSSSLLELNIAGIVSSRLVNVVGKSCSELTCLNVSGSLMVMDDAIISLCVGCSKLTELDVSDLDNLQFHSVKLILVSLKLLRNFKFARIHTALYQGIYWLLSQKFESFSVVDAHQDQVIGEVDDFFPDLMSYPLDTQPFSTEKHADKSKNVSQCVSFVQSKCVALTDLTLSVDLRVDVLLSLLNPIGGILLNLSLCEMTVLCDEHLNVVANLCVCLERFQLQDCQLVSDRGVIAVLLANQRISTLILGGGKFGDVIGNGVVSCGISTLLQLKYLRLVSLPGLTIEGLSYVAQKCLKLKDLEIVKCDHLPKKECETIFSGLLALNSLYVDK